MYYLLGGDISQPERYPPGCFPLINNTCPTAAVIDVDPEATLEAPEESIRWFRDTREGFAFVFGQLIDWVGIDFEIRVWVGTDCDDRELYGTLFSDEEFIVLLLEEGESIWYELESSDTPVAATIRME